MPKHDHTGEWVEQVNADQRAFDEAGEPEMVAIAFGPDDISKPKRNGQHDCQLTGCDRSVDKIDRNAVFN